MARFVSKAIIDSLVARGIARNPHLASRLDKAAALALAGKVEQLRSGEYVVSSQTGTSYYVVDADKRTCTCPDHAKRGGLCKHLLAALLVRRERQEDALLDEVDAWAAVA